MTETDTLPQPKPIDWSTPYWLLMSLCVGVIVLTVAVVHLGIGSVMEQAFDLNCALPALTVFYINHLVKSHIVLIGGIVGLIVVIAMAFVRRHYASAVVCTLVLWAHVLVLAGAVLAIGIALPPIYADQLPISRAPTLRNVIIDRAGQYADCEAQLMLNVRTDTGLVDYSLVNVSTGKELLRDRSASIYHRWFLFFDHDGRLWFWSSDIGGCVWDGSSLGDCKRCSPLLAGPYADQIPLQFKNRLPSSVLKQLGS